MNLLKQLIFKVLKFGFIILLSILLVYLNLLLAQWVYEQISQLFGSFLGFMVTSISLLIVFVPVTALMCSKVLIGLYRNEFFKL